MGVFKQVAKSAAKKVIEHRIREWARSDQSKELYEFLGMTHKEYLAWCKTGEIPSWMVK